MPYDQILLFRHMHHDQCLMVICCWSVLRFCGTCPGAVTTLSLNMRRSFIFEVTFFVCALITAMISLVQLANTHRPIRNNAAAHTQRRRAPSVSFFGRSPPLCQALRQTGQPNTIVPTAYNGKGADTRRNLHFNLPTAADIDVFIALEQRCQELMEDIEPNKCKARWYSCIKESADHPDNMRCTLNLAGCKPCNCYACEKEAWAQPEVWQHQSNACVAN